MEISAHCIRVFTFRNVERSEHRLVAARVVIAFKVKIHTALLRVPVHGYDVPFTVFNRRPLAVIGIIVVVCQSEILRGILVSVVVRPPVQCSAEVAVLPSGLYTFAESHLHDVHLTTLRPSISVDVVAHHPVCRPQSIGSLGEFNLCLNDTVLEIHLTVTVDTSGCELETVVVFALCGYDELSIGNLHVFRTIGVILQFTVAEAPVAVACLVVPVLLVQRGTIELVAPTQ